MENIDKVNESNDGYTWAKKQLEPKIKRCKEIEGQLTSYESELKMWQYLQKNPEQAKNEFYKKPEYIEEQIEKLKNKIKPLKRELISLQGEIRQFQQHIDDRVSELVRENPEVQKKIDELLAKKYTETIKKKKEGATKLTERKERITKIKDIIKEDPLVERALEEILKAQSEIKDLNKQLASITSKDKDGKIIYKNGTETQAQDLNSKIEAAEKKNTEVKDAFIRSVATKGLTIEAKDIDELVSGKIVKGKDGKILVDKTLSNEEKLIDKQVNKENKEISGYENRLTKMGVKLPEEKGKHGEQENPDGGNLPAPKKEKWYQKIKKVITRLFIKGKDNELENEGIDDRNVVPNGQPEPAQEEGKENKFIEQLQKTALFKEAVSRREKELQSKEEPGKDDREER